MNPCTIISQYSVQFGVWDLKCRLQFNCNGMYAFHTVSFDTKCSFIVCYNVSSVSSIYLSVVVRCTKYKDKKSIVIIRKKPFVTLVCCCLGFFKLWRRSNQNTNNNQLNRHPHAIYFSNTKRVKFPYWFQYDFKQKPKRKLIKIWTMIRSQVICYLNDCNANINDANVLKIR